MIPTTITVKETTKFNCKYDFTPRPHQLAAYNYAVSNPERVFIIEAIMGSGKNKLIQMLAQHYYLNNKLKVMIITDLTSVIDQLKLEAENFFMMKLPVYSCAKVCRDVTILDNYDVLIADECHAKFAKILHYIKEVNTRIRVIGFTATATNKTLLDYYQSIKCFATYNEMLDLGYLVNARFFGVKATHVVKTDDLKYTKTDSLDKESADKLNDRLSEISADLVTDYRTKEFNNSGIILMPSIKIANEVCDLFRADGIPSDVYTADSGTVAEKRVVLRNFVSGRTKVLVSVNAVSKGFDAPRAEFMFDCRPRSDKGGFDGYAQSIGRVLRSMSGKTEGRIYDYVGNYHKHADNLYAYFECGSQAVKIGKNAQKIIFVCEQCQFIITNKKDTHCKNCGAELLRPVVEEPAQKRERQEINIIKISPEMIELLPPKKTKITDMVGDNSDVLLMAFLATLKHSREVKGYGSEKDLKKVLWRAKYLTSDFIQCDTHIKVIEAMYNAVPAEMYIDCLSHIKRKSQEYIQQQSQSVL